MSERLKLKLLGRTTLKGKVGTHFPASVTGIDPIIVTATNGNYTIAIDSDALGSSSGDFDVPVTIVADNADASALAADPYMLSLQGPSNAVKLDFGVSLTDPDFSSWIQSRNYAADQPHDLLINPLGRHVKINTHPSLPAAFTSGMQIHYNWTIDDAYYTPPGGPISVNKSLTTFEGIDTWVRTVNNDPGTTSQAITAVAFADNAAGARGAWGVYTECHRVTTDDSVTNEFSVVNRINDVSTINPYTATGTSLNGGLLINCGTGAAFATQPQYQITAALNISQNAGAGQDTNTLRFDTGIVFRENSLMATHTPMRAISMQTGMGFTWWYPTGPAIGWSLYSTATSGSNSIILDETLATFSSVIKGQTYQEAVVTLTDGPSVSLNSLEGTIFHLTAAGDRTILAPTNVPASGFTQKLIIRHQASGANRTLALTTGSAGSFRFGSTITGLTATVSGAIDYIGCLWNQPADRWDVVAYSKGYA